MIISQIIVHLTSLMMSNKHWEIENRPFTVHLCTEVDLEVLSIVKDVQEGTALVKLGDAEERWSTVSRTIIPSEQMWLTEWMKPFTELMTSVFTSLLWNKRLLVTASTRPLHQNINPSRSAKCNNNTSSWYITLCSMIMSMSCSSNVQLF